MVGRTERNCLIDFCATWICEEDKPLDEIDMAAVIEGRIDLYDQRGFKLGIYYKGLSDRSYRRLVKSIQREVRSRRQWSTAASRRYDGKENNIIGQYRP